MKSLLLNTYGGGGGAAIAVFRLNKGLRDSGVDSRMLVQRMQSEGPNIIGPLSKFEKGIALLRPELDALPIKLYPDRTQFIFSPAIVPDSMSKKVDLLNPDLVHLHWIAGGFLRIETLKYFKRPIVWTLHDSWAFTGGCHIPFDCKRYSRKCGACPALGSNKERDLSRRIWRRKQKEWNGLDLTLVTPSRWLAESARSSSLFFNRKVEVIPNGLDTQLFRPICKSNARNILSMPQDKKLLLFGAISSISDRNKGFHFLSSALQMLAGKGWRNKCEFMVFGDWEPENPPDFGLKTHYLGKLNDEVSLALVYSAADLFVLPSIQENLPNTVIEALSCGIPCVTFNQGGLPDLIEHKQTGYLASPFDTNDLAEGINWILGDVERWKVLSQQARQKAEKEFDIRIIAKRYCDLYREVVGSYSKVKSP